MRATLRLRITGRVQGVGYRYALRSEALARGLEGWVRNRRDGSVEALVRGEHAEVEALAAWAMRGPPGARVDTVERAVAQDEELTSMPPGFEQRPTA